MVIANPKIFPYEVQVDFPRSEDGKICVPELAKSFERDYEGVFHRTYDFRSVSFYVRTDSDKASFSQTARDITQRLLNGQSQNTRIHGQKRIETSKA